MICQCELWARAEDTETISRNANRMVCGQTLLLLWDSWMHASTWLCLKTAGLLMSRSLKADGIQRNLWGVAWSTCIHNEGAGRRPGECSTRCHLGMWSFGIPYLGCAMDGHGREALKWFEKMCEEGVQPNDITFVCLLSPCSYSGFVHQGTRTTVYTISAKPEHYTCMVELLACAAV
jgi:pentatricopeptide repeat protein